ncbi:helix-turn-helix domain-containing protein [Alicyclobacillus tolerans]|nr:helix-turn-helix domain-containing protein [Alicyclobacillus tolerans]
MESGLDKATCHRSLSTLVRYGLLRKEQGTSLDTPSS